MKRLLLLLFILLLPAGAAQAQTATPTFAPNGSGLILEQGDHIFSTLAYFTYNGVWSTANNGQNTVRTSTATHAWVDFQVSEDICTMVIAGNSTNGTGLHVMVGSNPAGWLVSYNLIVGTGTSVGYTNPIDVSEHSGNGDFYIRIKSAGTGTGTIILWYVRLLECPNNVPQTPVPTATILSSSTPGVPTATAINTSTPAPTWTHAPYMTTYPTPTLFTPVPTATILPSSTPANTPVDTPTPLDVDPLLTLIAGLTPVTLTPSNTPTITNTPTATHTPTPEPRVCMTMIPGDATPTGQLACFEYTASASQIYIAVLVALLLISIWGFFFVYVLVLRRQTQ